MTSRKLATPTGILLALAAVGFFGLLRGEITPSAFIFRSAEELLALRSVLDDETAWADLSSLAEKMALWKIGTVPQEPPPGGAEGGERTAIHYRFEFASPRRVSSRVYRVQYESLEVADRQYRVERLRWGFGSNFRLGPEPLLRGSVPLEILKLAVKDPGVSQDLVETLREESIAYSTVVPEKPAGGGEAPRPGVSLYRFVAADGNPPARVVLEYLVEYDKDRRTASFTRL